MSPPTGNTPKVLARVVAAAADITTLSYALGSRIHNLQTALGGILDTPGIETVLDPKAIEAARAVLERSRGK